MKSSNNKILLSLAVITILTILLSSLVSAQWSRYYVVSPSDLLQNEWVVFGLIFAIFFAIIFFTLSKTFKENKAVAVIIAVAISFFVSSILSRRINFYGYIGEEVGGWIMFIVLLVVLILGLKAIGELTKSPIVLAAGIIGIWALFRFLEWDLILPYEIIDSTFFQIISGQIGLIIAIILAIIIIIARKQVKDALRRKTNWERMWTNRD